MYGKTDRRLWITVVVVVVAIISAGIAVGIYFGVTRRSTVIKDDNNSLDEILANTEISFPNGSYALDVSSVSAGPADLAPLNLTTEKLLGMGVTVDQSLDIVIPGRKSYVYVWLPASNSTSRQKRATNEEDLGLRFGNSQKITVVPKSLASIPGSGVRQIKQSDGSSVFEVQLTIPSQLCTELKSDVCSPFSWTPYTVLSGDSSASIGIKVTNYVISCGDQCDPSKDETRCSINCQACSSQTVAGADTPVSRLLYLGKAKATVDFSYETYSVEDRIKVVYENEIIFDSGCIGTNGERSRNISFAGKSSEIRVDVEPNCACLNINGCGTLWYFTMGCPSPCDSTNSGKLVITDNGQILSTGSTASISTLPQMPQLSATYCDQSAKAYLWQVTVQQQPSSNSLSTICPMQSFQATGTSIDISRQVPYILGGQYNVTVFNISTDMNPLASQSFSVIAKNPDQATITAKVTALSKFWYAVPIVAQESSYRQFVTNGQPLISSDNGYGLFQLTNPPPTCQQVWDWTENVAAASALLQSQRNGTSSSAENWMQNQRSQARNQEGHDVPVPTVNEANCVFREGGPRIIDDAVAIKIFNGASGGQYCAWDNTTAVWKFNKLNILNRNYVNDVCKHV